MEIGGQQLPNLWPLKPTPMVLAWRHMYHVVLDAPPPDSMCPTSSNECTPPGHAWAHHAHGDGSSHTCGHLYTLRTFRIFRLFFPLGGTTAACPSGRVVVCGSRQRVASFRVAWAPRATWSALFGPSTTRTTVAHPLGVHGCMGWPPTEGRGHNVDMAIAQMCKECTPHGCACRH